MSHYSPLGTLHELYGSNGLGGFRTQVQSPDADFTKDYHMAKVTSWLDRGGDINTTAFSKQGHTLLMMGCIQDHYQLAEDLVRRRANLDMKAGGKTALMFAAVFGNYRCVEALLAGGANIHIRSDVDDTEYTEYDGMTALEMIVAEIAKEGQTPRNRKCMLMLQQAAQEQQQQQQQQQQHAMRQPRR